MMVQLKRKSDENIKPFVFETPLDPLFAPRKCPNGKKMHMFPGIIAPGVAPGWLNEIYFFQIYDPFLNKNHKLPTSRSSQ